MDLADELVDGLLAAEDRLVADHDLSTLRCLRADRSRAHSRSLRSVFLSIQAPDRNAQAQLRGDLGH
jgi:hypothetical protein